MTDLYGVRVHALEGARAELEVLAVYGAVPEDPPRSRGFFLRALRDGAPAASPLAAAVTAAEAADGGFLAAHAARFVATVELLRAEPPAPGTRRPVFARRRGGGWGDETRLPRARCAVTLTHPAWAAHLVPGAAWGTAAADPW